MTVALIVLLTQAWDQSRQHRDADFKYRYLLLSDNQSLLDLLHQTDSVYLIDPGRFSRHVIQGEQERQERLENLQRLQDAKEQQRQMEEKLKIPGPQSKTNQKREKSPRR